MHPLVSITMSTYNVEEFIQDSLDSIVNQSFKDIEIIIIDDGSTDATPSIIKQYAANDSRIRVVEKAINQGLAVARNEALKLAKGKYLTFLDGDDLYDLDMIQKAYEMAEKENSDIVLWDYVTFWNPLDIEEKKKEPSALLTISDKDKIALLQRPSFTWVKLIETEVARNMGISFPKGLTRQDVPVHWHLITKIDRISILPERLSYYRQQPQATTHKKDARLFDLATVMDITKTYLINSDLYETYKDEFLRQQLGFLSGMIDFIEEPLKQKAMKMINDRMGDDQLEYINSKKPLRWQTRDFYLALNGSTSAKTRRYIWLLSRRIYRSLKPN